MHHPRRCYSGIIFVFLLLGALSVAGAGCAVDTGAPSGPQMPRGIKLTGHRELSVEDAEPFESLLGEFTIGSDTRRGFRIGDGAPLRFSLEPPGGGKVRFAYGCGPEAFKYAREIRLKITITSGEETFTIGEAAINTRSTDEIKSWHDMEIDIPAGITGKVELAFVIDGVREGSTLETFILAHPTLIFPPGRTKPRRVVLIGIDTLRADHLGCYGYERDTSPNIDVFTNEAVLYERCISVSPWTYPSFGAMFTGSYPTVAGAVTNVKFLPDEDDTLAEILSRDDFSTFSVANSPWVGKMTNMNQGFDMQVEMLHRRAEEPFKTALEWLAKHPDEDSFIFIHLMDPHLPYSPKPENAGRFGPRGYSGEYKNKFDIIPRDIELMRAGELPVSEEDKQRIEALYDEEIYGLDQDFEKFITSLKDGGFYDDSMIVIISDHGEEFWEHGGYEHGHQLYDELLHVPLIIKGTGFPAGERIEALCSTIDIFPTILDYLGLEIPGGLNAKVLPRAGGDSGGRWILSEQLFYGVEQKAVSSDDYRYIFHTLDASDELYDTRDDPGMRSDVAGERRATSRRFRTFIQGVTIMADNGWHLRFARGGASSAGRLYDVTVRSDGGFTDVTGHLLDDKDILSIEGDTIKIKINLYEPGEKMVNFTTPDENQKVNFNVRIDNLDDDLGLIHLGPEKVPFGENEFDLLITDERFGLGTPNFRKGHDPGLYIWGISSALQEEMKPFMDDRIKEELKSLGYLQ